jgi:gliding motility-associated-like protein
MVTSLNLPVAYYVPSDTLGNVLFTVSFTNFSQFGNTYTWDFGDGETYTTSTTETVTHTYDQPGTYTITVLATNGICSDSWSSDIIVLPPMIVEPPNVFTPNGDGLNDFYFVNVENVEFFEAAISNRWGNIMAELNSPMQPWDGITDGQEANEGVYFIQFKAVDYGGNTIENHTFFHLNRK